MRLSDDVLRNAPGDCLDLEWRGPEPSIEVVDDDDPLQEITALWVDGNTVATFVGCDLASECV